MKKSLNLLGVVLVSAIIASTSVVSAGDVKFGPEFSKKTSVIVKVIQGEELCENPKKSKDSHELWAETTNSFTGTLSGEAEVKAFTKSLKLSLSVSYGKSKKTTTKHVWTIDPKSVYVCEWGYCNKDVSGTMYTYKEGKIVTKRLRKASYGVMKYYGGHYVD